VSLSSNPPVKPPRRNLERILKGFRSRRIGVVGDLMLDRYMWGKATRLSPEAAVPVVEFVQESCCLGGAGNVAANLVALGGHAELFGVTGTDADSRALGECVRTLGIPEKGIVADASRPTTVKTRIIARHQQVVRVDRETRAPLPAAVEDRLIRRVKAALARLDALVISDYDKGTVTERLTERVLEACQRQNLPVFVKPKWSRLPVYRGATAVVCNRAEASFLVTRALDDDESVEQAGRALLAHFGCPAVIVTRGEQGMNVFEQDSRATLHIPALSRELPYGRLGQPAWGHATPGRQVFDVTGAGDTVLATLALAVAAGASIAEAAVLANAAAGVVVAKLGTATATPTELRAALADSS